MIESAKFTESGTIEAVIDGVKYFIPDDMANRHRQMLAEWEADGGVIHPYAPPPPTKQELSGYAAQKRYEKEIGGTIWNGWPVHTDRESQSKIIAERLAIEAGERTDPDGWKFADGVFRMVSNADFMDLASDVRQHVRDCFALEAAILAQIDAGTITEYGQIDAAFE